MTSGKAETCMRTPAKENEKRDSHCETVFPFIIDRDTNPLCLSAILRFKITESKQIRMFTQIKTKKEGF